MAATNVSLKIHRQKEATGTFSPKQTTNFVDFLLSIFTLLVGVVTRLLKDGGGVVGCLPSLYQSIKNLSVTYIKPDKNKLFLLEPKLVMPGAEVPLLLPNVGSTFSQLYRCPNTGSNCLSFAAVDVGTICPSCKSKMDRNVKCVDPTRATRAASAASEEGYVIGTVAYMVMDDLELKPSSSSFLVTLLTKFNVKDVGDIEEKVVDMGLDEV
ncbi:uncharacterized protein LOC132188073 [Corylus avellana]|uniref:uncharacterized protein LOC132188073 n=1 Tax=Corylus avellana TaxID=13451 RepID=UPI00286B1DA7|nr:uncharacterized protein LOC132188073 [Corylus avellana]